MSLYVKILAVLTDWQAKEYCITICWTPGSMKRALWIMPENIWSFNDPDFLRSMSQVVYQMNIKHIKAFQLFELIIQCD